MSNFYYIDHGKHYLIVYITDTFFSIYKLQLKVSRQSLKAILAVT